MVRELGLLALLTIVYEEIAAHLVQAGSAAASHALMVVGAERALGLFDERAVQAAFLHYDTITDAFNNTVTATTPVLTVGDAPLSPGAPLPVSATRGQPLFSVPVATFVDGNPGATAADFAAFLASDRAKRVTGGIFPVDSGYTAFKGLMSLKDTIAR